MYLFFWDSFDDEKCDTCIFFKILYHGCIDLYYHLQMNIKSYLQVENKCQNFSF